MTECPDRLPFEAIAAEVEGAFGLGSVGLFGDSAGKVTDEARSAFVRAALLLVSMRCYEGGGERGEDLKTERFKANREARREMAELLGVDENEVFRLHHRAARLRCEDGDYRRKAQVIESGLVERLG